MTSKQKDPREAVLSDIFYQWTDVVPLRSELEGKLARLNAADPLRAMLPEVVEALEDSWSPYTDDSPYDVKWAARRENLLTRLRALTATEGGTDDGE